MTYDLLIHASSFGLPTSVAMLRSQQDKAVTKAGRIELFTGPILEVAVKYRMSKTNGQLYPRSL